jgi:Co/Zn/Cd efflux system component
MDAPVVAEVREAVGGLTEPAKLRDLHVWRVGKGKYACIVSIETDAEFAAVEVRGRLAAHDELVHVTVEIVPAS